MVMSDDVNPVTDSLKATVTKKLATFVGLVALEVIVIVGAVLSIVKNCPVAKLPFPNPVPPNLLEAMSNIVSLSVTSNRSVPEPAPVFTVTVRVVPVPVTPITEGPDIVPLDVMLKSAESTPVTDSLKMTVKVTLAAFVGLVPDRLLEITVGTTES